MVEHARCHVWTIGEILGHPRYREFAAAVTEQGRRVNPAAFPHKYLGLSEAEFLACPIRCESGELPSPELKRDWLAVVRAAEREVVTWWNWWLSWEWIAQRHETKLEPVVAVKAAPGMLF